MKKYSNFIFESYEFNRNTGRVVLRYRLDNDLSFTEVLTLPVDGMQLDTIDEDELDAALFALHLIGGISYYKTCLPPNIKIESGMLNQQQAAFWKTVYENGLGEFFYRNNINFLNLIDFPHTKVQKRRINEVRRSSAVREKTNRVLVPVGGGKDSIVSMELLKKSAESVMLFRMGSHPSMPPIIEDLAYRAGLPILSVKRQIDPELFQLNKDGALNGHVPITAYLSFLSVLMGVLYGFDSVVLSNEGSASEGNVQFHGREINHQWSKGLHFERMMRDFTSKWITPHVEYFSLLRPMTELKVTQLFAQYPQYFTSFTSCNANWKIIEGAPIERWCNHCPKCAFVYALLAAFLPKATMLEIFGKDLYADESLLPLYRELLGLENHKPFECVGTPDETKAAFLLARNRGDFAGSAAMAMFEAEALPGIKEHKKLIDAALTLGDEHFIPDRYIPLLPTD